MKSKLSVEPSIEPVSLEEVKSYLRITDSSENEIIDCFIEDARRIAERETGRKLITQTLVGYADSFGGHQTEWWTGTRRGAIADAFNDTDGFITLDWGLAQSISQIDLVDTGNSETVFASSNYYLDNFDNAMFPVVRLNNDATIPVSLRNKNGVKVTWIAGYGDTATSVPSDIRLAIKKMVSTLYYSRGDCEDCAGEAGVMSQLRKYRIRGL